MDERGREDHPSDFMNETKSENTIHPQRSKTINQAAESKKKI